MPGGVLDSWVCDLSAGCWGREVREVSEDTNALWQSLQMADEGPHLPGELPKAREPRVLSGTGCGTLVS